MLAVILKEGQQTMSDPQNNQDKLKEVLAQIRKLHESAELTGENFNVFSILHRESDEVKTHSAIIAELLNPYGSHSQGTLFLKLFLEKLLKEEIPKLKCGKDGLNDEYLKKFEVGVEVSFNKGRSRIDILLEKDDDCVVIENKIWADDQPRQLERYHEYATRKSEDPILIYLTPYDGTEPGKDTLGCLPENKVVCLSYCKDIIEWVDACIKEAAHIPRISETLHQYQMTIRKLTGKLPPEVEELNEDKELKDRIIKHLQCEFWKKLKEQLADQNPKFQLYESGMKHTEILDGQLKDLTTHPSLGLTFSIPNSLTSDKEHEVAFRVYYERSTIHSYFNYGFVFCKRGTLQRDKFEKDEKGIKQFKIKGWPEGEGNDGWISWKYFRYAPGDFVTENKETLIRRITSEINSLLWQSRRARKDN